MILRNQNGRRDGLLQSVRNLPARLVKLRRGLKLESGGSLPAALITLAVGSMLLTPFLSFVSTRSLGTRAAGETFHEQYAADAGVEYGIWSLLNDLEFRIQVDSSIGTAQPLPFLIPINGYTPSISVTGIPIGKWYLREFFPSAISSGGSLAYVPHVLGDRVYALRGNGTKNFGYYSILAEQWTSLKNTPKGVNQGGALVYPGGDYLYALRGDGENDFWRYDINDNKWKPMKDIGKKVEVGAGGALTYTGGYIYALQGGNNKGFWRYNISKKTWKSMPPTLKDVGGGGALVAVEEDLYAFRGKGKSDFWHYDTSSDSWSDLADALGNVGDGGSLAYYNGNYIYALQGKSTGFWRYAVTMNSWTVLEETLNPVGNGGSLVVTHSLGGFAFRGDKKNDFWEFDVIPRFDISSQAGSVGTNARIEIYGSTNTILFWDIE